MDINLEQLKKNFIKIKEIRSKVTDVFKIVEAHLLNLKKMYSEFIENNRQHLFVFGLDSFQFQSKLIDIEYDDMKRLFLAINNRMYCEYYKLHKIIAEYVKENIPDKKTLDLIKITNTFSVYKDLEPYKQYKFETTQEIHENIILLLYEINEFIINKEHVLQIHKKKQEIGLNINNFVTTFNYNIIIIKEKGILFMSYIDFFHNLHTKYLQRFTMKMNLMYNQVTHDIQFENTPKHASIKKKELIDDFETHNIDKELIKEIKTSFYDTDSNDSDSPITKDIKKDPNSPSLSLTKNIISLNENTLNANTNTNTNTNTNANANTNPINNNLKSVFKNNVKKLINGMSVFNKKKNKNKEIMSTYSSSDESLNDMNKHIQDNILDMTEIENVKINVDDKIKEEDKMIVEHSKSIEDIFTEITQQCVEITDKKSNLSNKMSQYDFLYINEINKNNKNVNDMKNELLTETNNSDNIIIDNNPIEPHIDHHEDHDSVSIMTLESINENYTEERMNHTEEKEEKDEENI